MRNIRFNVLAEEVSNAITIEESDRTIEEWLELFVSEFKKTVEKKIKRPDSSGLSRSIQSGSHFNCLIPL